MRAALLGISALMLAVTCASSPLFAQTGAMGGGSLIGAGATGTLTLWTDPKTGQVFTRPGHGRVPLQLGVVNPADQRALEQQLETQKAETKKLELQVSQQAEQAAAVQKQVSDITPAWQDYLANYKNKVSFGTQVWFAYALYPHTGYGPQFLTQNIWPGNGNNMYNEFFLHRAYLNFFFYPTKDWTVRVTPNIYTMQGNTSNQGFGRNGSVPNTNVGNLGYRVKYAYLQWNTPFKKNFGDAIKDDMIIAGVQPQPLTAWEEDLYGFRYVNLTTWNMSEASTFPGLSIQGPIKFGADHLQYLDYNVGVFNNASFHAFEGTNTKEAQARVSIYPFGAKWRFDGLGLTSYYSYGYGNNTPDLAQVSTPYKGPNAVIQRLAEIVHYTADNWGLAFEYDWGRNAWSPGNAFSGSGPDEVFGIAPGNASLVLPQTQLAHLANALLNNGRTQQQGFNFFGHLHIPNTRFTLFGWLEQWNANTNVTQTNPFDFQRAVLGISYQWNEYLRFALDTQNILYYHKQFNFPVSEAEEYNYQPVKGEGTTITNAVPRDTHAFMLNAEFMF